MQDKMQFLTWASFKDLIPNSLILVKFFKLPLLKANILIKPKSPIQK